MAVLVPTTAAPDQRIHDHSRPLDTVILCLEDTPCAWCHAMLTLLKRHLEDLAFRGQEALN
jgi:hypothetical protein